MLQFLRKIRYGDLEPVRSFTCFSRLPVELQLEIWRFALPERRIVILGLWQNLPKALAKIQGEEINLLYTCRNSRFVVGQFYRRMNDGPNRHVLYLNAVKDILLIRNLIGLLEPFSQLPVAELNECVSTLALQVWLPYSYRFVPVICDTVKKIRSLKDLVIVVTGPVSFENYRYSMEFVQSIQNQLLEMQMIEENGDSNSDKDARWQIPKIRRVRSPWPERDDKSMVMEEALMSWNNRRAMEEDYN
jgi:hypothetical protein